MNRVLAKIYLISVVFLFADKLMASNPSEIQDATLGCMAGPSQSIYLFQDQKSVLIAASNDHVLPLSLEKFEVYRCPGCFGFVGRAEGRLYQGETEGVLDEKTGHWAVYLELAIDGVKAGRFNCFLHGLGQ